MAKALRTCSERKKVREERGASASFCGPCRRSGAREAGAILPERSWVPAVASCSAFHPGSSPWRAPLPSNAFRQSGPEGWPHVARQPGLEGGRSSCAREPGLLCRDARPSEVAEQSMRVRDCEPAAGPQGVGRRAWGRGTQPPSAQDAARVPLLRPPAGKKGPHPGATGRSSARPGGLGATAGAGDCGRAVGRHCPLAGGMFHSTSRLRLTRQKHESLSPFSNQIHLGRYLAESLHLCSPSCLTAALSLKKQTITLLY